MIISSLKSSMKKNFTVLFTLLLIASISTFAALRLFDSPSDFSKSKIDIGLVVSDIEASTKFYKNTLGMYELNRFSVDAEFCTQAGLTDGQALNVRAFGTSKGENTTLLKIMQVPNVDSKKSNNAFIHTQLGFSYITIYVTDMTKTLERLATTGVKPLAKGPVQTGKDPDSSYLIMVKDPDGNLIELIGPIL